MNTKNSQIITVVFLAISAVLVWQIINIYPEIGILRDKIKTQEMIFNDSEDTLKRLKELIAFTEKNNEAINKFDLILPANEDKAVLLSNMESLASDTGLVALKITFEENNKSASGQQVAAGAVPENYDFDSKNIAMSLRGGYFSFKNFLSAMEKNLRVTDIASIDFSADSSSQETGAERKPYYYNVKFKTYLYKPLKEENIADLLSAGKFKNFTAKRLNFIKEKLFSDLFLPSGYNIDAGAGEIGNKNIF